MPDLTLWGLFIVASVVLLLTPGPAVLFIVARSLEQGRAAGLVSVLGIHLGTIVHITAAAVGLSALLVSSALAFAIVKYLGAAYLIWIGIRTLLAKDPDPDSARGAGRAAAPGLPRWLRGQSLQSEDGDLLPRLPAAIRRSRARRGALADPHPRPHLHGARHHERWDVRADRRSCRRFPAPEPSLPAPSALVRRIPHSSALGSPQPWRRASNPFPWPSARLTRNRRCRRA